MPILSLRRPTPATIEAFLAREATFPFSYPAVGSTEQWPLQPPRGYVVDQHQVCLGTGEAVYVAACDALRSWRMFPKSWIEVLPRSTPIHAEQCLAVVAKAFGIYWTSSARIVYVTTGERELAFAYGTLPGHLERGEEQFSVRWDENDRVWYSIRAFSRPRFWPLRLAYPLTRRLQQQFGRESKLEMLEATAHVSAKTHAPA